MKTNTIHLLKFLIFKELQRKVNSLANFKEILLEIVWLFRKYDYSLSSVNWGNGRSTVDSVNDRLARC